MKNYYFILIFLLVMASCRSSQDAVRLKMINDNSYCQNSQSVFHFDSMWLERLKHDTVFTAATQERFSVRARNIAKDMDIASVLNDYTTTEKQKGIEKDLLAGKIAIFTHHADLEVSSCVAELTCELNRAEDFRNYLQGRIQRRINRLTIASILIGAGTSIIVNVTALDNDRAAKYSQAFKYGFIGSSLVGSALSIRSFFLTERAVFVHRRNALNDLWESPKQPKVLSPIVWRFINKKFQKRGQWTSGREILLDQWKDLGLLVHTDNPKLKPRVDALLGTKGEYDMGLIEARISMLKMLIEEINLMLYDLKRLQQELVLPPR